MSLCVVCRARVATVPDRNKPGRLINRLCSACHGQRLSGDLKRIVTLAVEKKNQKDET
jgi:hypothetical protein